MRRACVAWKVKQVNAMYTNDSLVFDNIIQRNYVWSPTQQSMFIDSLIRNFPVSVIYTIKTNEKISTPKKISNVYDCLDGKQRCTTLHKYLNNEFCLTGLEPFITSDGTEIDLNGKYFKDLDKVWQDKILNYGMTVYYFTEISDEEISEMMFRLNGGRPLSGVENARIRAKNLPAIQLLAAHDVIKNNLSSTSIRNYSNEDIIIKTSLLINGITDLSNSNVRMAYETYKFNSEERYTILNILEIMNSIITNITNGEYKKTTLRKIITKTNFITTLYAIYKLKNKYTVEELTKAIYTFYDNIPTRYSDANKSATMRSTNVVIRNEELIQSIEESLTSVTKIYTTV